MTRLPRMTGVLIISIALTAAIYFIAPHQLPVTLYKLSMVTLSAWVAYWIDRWLYPDARVDSFLTQSGNKKIVISEMMAAFCAAQYRRAIIVIGTMIAVALGA